MTGPREEIDVAQALSAALEPLAEVCLKIGITSPELESLLRVVFVQRAIKTLPKHWRTQRGASDSRVSAATGVHRNEVRKIREAGTARAKDTMRQKRATFSRSAKILSGWTTDPRFLTSAGHPSDLPLERNRERRSFADLVEKYAPGTFPSSALKELRRRRCVDLIDQDIVRFKSQTTRAVGLTKANLNEAAQHLKQLGDTLFYNAVHHGDPRPHADIEAVRLSPKQLAHIRTILERRIKTFIDATASELAGRAEPVKPGEAVRLGLTVFSWEEHPEGTPEPPQE